MKKIDEKMVWNMALWLYLTEISIEPFTPKRNKKLNLHKLIRFDLGTLLSQDINHQRAIIPTLLFHIENNFNLNSQVWQRLLLNFRSSRYINICVFFTITTKTRQDFLDSIIILSIDDAVEYETAKFFAESGRLARFEILSFVN